MLERCFSVVITEKTADNFNYILSNKWLPLYQKQLELKDNNCSSIELDKKVNLAMFNVAKLLTEMYPEEYKKNIYDIITKTQTQSEKPSFLNVVFMEHSFGVVIFNNNISIIDSIKTPTGLCFEQLLNIINTKYYNENFKINYIPLEQQSDKYSCPYFAASNITKLDKLFHKNPEEFCKLINIEKDIVIPPLFVINTTQSLTGIEKQTGLTFEEILNTDDIEIEKLTSLEDDENTSLEEIDVVPINNDDTIILDNFFSEKVAINKSNSKINLTDEDLNKMIKYFTYKEHTNKYGKTKNKLQNLRVYYKSRDMLIKFLEANKDFTQQEEVAQSPAK